MKDDIDQEIDNIHKTVFKVAKRGIWAVLIIGLLNLLLGVAVIGGGIYFIFWCLKHFGVIGA